VQPQTTPKTEVLSPPPPGVPGLPNVIIIGAAKCGTTSLYHYLGQHPEVAQAAHCRPKKEMDFFSDPDWRSRLDWYRAHFPTDHRVRV
jgi:hypothetical protein